MENLVSIANRTPDHQARISAALSGGRVFRTIESLALETSLPRPVIESTLGDPRVARRTQVRDPEGRPLFVAAGRRLHWLEHLALIRYVLAR